MKDYEYQRPHWPQARRQDSDLRIMLLGAAAGFTLAGVLILAMAAMNAL